MKTLKFRQNKDGDLFWQVGDSKQGMVEYKLQTRLDMQHLFEDILDNCEDCLITSVENKVLLERICNVLNIPTEINKEDFH